MKRRALKTILLTLLFLLFVAVALLVYIFSLRKDLAYDFAYSLSSTTLDSWPAYDANYDLPLQDGALTQEGLAYYIATKVPEEYKASLKGVKLIKEYSAVILDDYDEPPYTNSTAIAEATALEFYIKFDENCAYFTSYRFYALLTRHTDYEISVYWLNNVKTDLKNVVKQSHYTRYVPDYVIQPQ